MTAANTPQAPKSATRATNRPDVAPSASGALTEAERADLRNAFRRSAWLEKTAHDAHEWTSFEDDALHWMIPVVESLIAARVDAALAEVERQVCTSVSPNFGMRQDGTVDPMSAGYVEGLHDAYQIVRNYREDHR